MAIKLEVGMYVKTLKENTAYNPNTFEVIGALPVGTQCKINQVVALLLTDDSICVAVIVVHNNIQYVFLQDSTKASELNFEVL